MMIRWSVADSFLPLALWAILVFHTANAPGQMQDDLSRVFQDATEAKLATDWPHLSAALARIAQSEDWKPRVSQERERGAASAVYAIAAPATVVVRCGNSHGTGFLVDPEGWIVTNHHVIEDAAVDVKTSRLIATIYFGILGKDGFMHLIDQGCPAAVYKSSEEKDLALLRLLRLPMGLRDLPVLKLASEAPGPGSACVVIGHPAAGVLWTVRSGEVSGVGNWPTEMIDVVMQRLALSGDDRQRFEKIFERAPQRTVVISSCGLNPGDSGGPLVNTKGEVIGVSYAIPAPPAPEESPRVSLDKFSYHVHFRELDAFLRDRPKRPMIYVPDPWPPGTHIKMGDFDSDGTADAIAVTLPEAGLITGMLFDLDQDSRPPEAGHPYARHEWDFEFVHHRFPDPRTFYDTDNDGAIDLVIHDPDGDGSADGILKRTANGWAADPSPSGRVIHPGRFEEQTLQKRLAEFLAGRRKKQDEERRP
jgi:serine protease Do